jgi:hypothetical protein
MGGIPAKTFAKQTEWHKCMHRTRVVNKTVNRSLVVLGEDPPGRTISCYDLPSPQETGSVKAVIELYQ